MLKKKGVEDHHRISSFLNKTKSLTACNDSLNAKTSNFKVVCVTCGKCVFNSNHDDYVSKFINDVNARTKTPHGVPVIIRKPTSKALFIALSFLWYGLQKIIAMEDTRKYDGNGSLAKGETTEVRRLLAGSKITSMLAADYMILYHGLEPQAQGDKLQMRLLKSLNGIEQDIANHLCSSLLGQYKDPAIANILIEELIEEADGFAGVFPGAKSLTVNVRICKLKQTLKEILYVTCSQKKMVFEVLKISHHVKMKDREEDHKWHTIAHAMETQNMLALELDFTLNATT
ncbi:hypothetical protein Tco_0430864 [Tanacetum coccineum]